MKPNVDGQFLFLVQKLLLIVTCLFTLADARRLNQLFWDDKGKGKSSKTFKIASLLFYGVLNRSQFSLLNNAMN